MTLYTLTEHETLDNFVVAVSITPRQTENVRRHMGVIFDDFAKADNAADDINDWACQREDGPEPLYPNKTAHITGFTSRCRIDGRRLYIPTTTPTTASKETTVPTEIQRFTFGKWVFNINKAEEIIAAEPRVTIPTEVPGWAAVYQLDRLRPDYAGASWCPIFGPDQRHFNYEHAMSTDLAKPVIIALVKFGDDVNQLLIDGTHRMFHAHTKGLDTLPAYFLSVEETEEIQQD